MNPSRATAAAVGIGIHLSTSRLRAAATDQVTHARSGEEADGGRALCRHRQFERRLAMVISGVSMAESVRLLLRTQPRGSGGFSNLIGRESRESVPGEGVRASFQQNTYERRVFVHRRPHERCAPKEAAQIRVGTRGKQPARNVLMPEDAGGAQGRVRHGRRVRRRSTLHEEIHHGPVSGLGSKDQGRPSFAVHGIHVGLPVEECRSFCEVASARCFEQPVFEPRIASVCVCHCVQTRTLDA